jgi:hypothetical protein
MNRLALTMNADEMTQQSTNGHRPFSLSWLKRVVDRWRQTDSNAPYRRLALQLHYDLPREEGNRSVLIATPTRSPLGASASLHLARSLAEHVQQPVILADTSREGVLSTLLGCESMPGLREMLTNEREEMGDYLLPTSAHHVAFLPSGRRSSDGTLAASTRIAPLVAAARRQSDFIVFSGGAILDDSLSLAVAPHVGLVLLLAMENETLIEDLEEAKQTLERCHAPRLALVFSQKIPAWALPDPVDQERAGGATPGL